MRTDPATTPELPAACPSCGAAVRSSVPWCGQCFVSLAPATIPSEQEPSEQEPVEQEPAQDEPAPEPMDGPGAERAHLDVVADQLLGELAAQQPAVFGSWMPAGRVARAGVLTAGGVCGCLLLLGLLAAAGLFL